MISPPHKRSKSRRVTEPTHRSAKDVEVSNSTAKSFLGGKQKSWMTGTLGVNSGYAPLGVAKLSQILSVGHRSTQPATIAPPTAFQNEKVMSKVSEKPAGFVDLTAKRSFSREEANVSQEKNSRIAMVVAETVLPSPAPSDDIQTLFTEPADSEKLREEENLEAETHTQRLKELADSFGGIKQLMEHIQETTVPSDSDKSKQVNKYAGEVGGVLSRKRKLQCEIIPHKDPQMLPGSSSRCSSERPRVDQGSLRPTTNTSPQSHKFTSTLLSAPRIIENSVVSRLDFGGFLQILESRVNQVNRAKNPHTGIEIARLRLLQKACTTHDIGYLILHQLYCLRINKSKNLDEFLDLTQEHRNGLIVISHLLLQNDQMTDDAVQWFEDFPRPLIMSLRTMPEVCQAYERVKSGLVNLAREWQQFKTLCQQRKIPPLVDELLSVLGIDSPVLQQVLFRAVKREYWVGDQDQCYRQGEHLFEQNQRGIRERDPRICTSQPHVVAYNQPFMYEYRRVWARHLQHASQPNVDLQYSTGLSSGTLSASPSQHAQYGKVTVDGNGLRSGSFGTYANAIPPRPSLSIDTDSRRSTDASTTDLIGQSGRKQPRGSADNFFPYPRPRYSAPPTPVVPSNAMDMPTAQIANTWPSEVIVPEQFPHAHLILSPGCTNPARPSVIATARVASQQQGLEYTGPVATDRPIYRRPLPTKQTTSLGERLSTGLRQDPSLQYRQHNMTQQPVQQKIPGGRSSTDPRLFEQRNLDFVNVPNRSATSYVLHEPHWQSARLNSSSTSLPITSPVPLVANASTSNQTQVEQSVMKWSVDTEDIDDAGNHRYFEAFAVKPVLLDSSQQYFEQTLHITEDVARTLVTTGPWEHGSSGSRVIRANRLLRLRIVKATSLNADLTEDKWTVAPSLWPRNIAVSLNGIGLCIGQKAQPPHITSFDLTQYVNEGDNNLSISIIGPPDDPAHGHFAAVEILRVTNDEIIKSNIARLTISEALKRLSNHSSTPDPDVQIVDAPLIVDLTDPYTSRIFDTPIRSLHCQHHQCFDLENFLRTRKGTFSTGPGQPEEFKCPICKSDARPEKLFVDEFFVKVRDELEHAGRLDARAILINETGDWRIKDNEEIGESGDGSSIGESQLKGLANVRDAEGTLRKDSIYIDLDD